MVVLLVPLKYSTKVRDTHQTGPNPVVRPVTCLCPNQDSARPIARQMSTHTVPEMTKFPPTPPAPARNAAAQQLQMLSMGVPASIATFWAKASWSRGCKDKHWLVPAARSTGWERGCLLACPFHGSPTLASGCHEAQVTGFGAGHQHKQGSGQCGLTSLGLFACQSIGGGDLVACGVTPVSPFKALEAPRSSEIGDSAL